MRNILKIMKPLDVIIIALLVMISFIPLTVFSMTNTYNEGDDVVAIIMQDGAVIEEITLTGHVGRKEILVEGTGDQYNLVEIEDERIRIQHDNTPHQVGVSMGWKDKPGETIVSLPHKLLIELRSDGNSDEQDTDIISY